MNCLEKDMLDRPLRYRTNHAFERYFPSNQASFRYINVRKIVCVQAKYLRKYKFTT